jgi:hypothetical protein
MASRVSSPVRKVTTWRAASLVPRKWITAATVQIWRGGLLVQICE